MDGGAVHDHFDLRDQFPGVVFGTVSANRMVAVVGNDCLRDVFVSHDGVGGGVWND